MKQYAIYDNQTGVVLTVTSQNGPVSSYLIPSGCSALEVNDPVEPMAARVVNGEIISIPKKPSQYHVWQNDGWVDSRPIPTLAEEKEKKNIDINIERERRGVLPILFAGIEWDADKTAQRNISAWMASIAAGVTIPTEFVWRATDNTNHPADAAFVNGLGASITLRGTLLYQTSWGKKAEVNALTTVDAVKAYDVTAGW
jgi:hypothetical protein